MSLNPDLLEHLHTQGLWSTSAPKTFGVWGIWSMLGPKSFGASHTRAFGICLHQKLLGFLCTKGPWSTPAPKNLGFLTGRVLEPSLHPKILVHGAFGPSLHPKLLGHDLLGALGPSCPKAELQPGWHSGTPPHGCCILGGGSLSPTATQTPTPCPRCTL